MSNNENKRDIYLHEVALFLNTNDSLVMHLFNSGLLDAPPDSEDDFFDSRDLDIIRRAARIQKDFGVNAEGIDVILHMHQQLRQLQDELTTLRRFYHQFGNDQDDAVIDIEL